MSSLLARVRRFRWQQWLLVIAMAAALVFTAIQVWGMAGHVRSLRALRNDPIAPWMTVSHVARAFRVPEAMVEEAIGLPPGSGDRRPLAFIARQRGEPFEAVRDRIASAIARVTPSPTPPPRPPGER